MIKKIINEGIITIYLSISLPNLMTKSYLRKFFIIIKSIKAMYIRANIDIHLMYFAKILSKMLNVTNRPIASNMLSYDNANGR
jgi:hypothetical protein